MEPIEKDDHFIPDGMNAFERNVKRIGDCILALGALIVFSPLFLFRDAESTEKTTVSMSFSEVSVSSQFTYKIYYTQSLQKKQLSLFRITNSVIGPL